MSETAYERPRHATRVPGHPVLKTLLLATVGILTFSFVLVHTYVGKIEEHLDIEDIAPLLGPDRPDVVINPEDGAAGRALNIVLMGSDDRSGENAAIGGVEAGKRNDTTLIMHISADRRRVELVSIPRDTMVNLASCDRSDGSTQRAYFGQFNEAFANGARPTDKNSDGAACTIRTIESLTDIYVDHYAVIDFTGFRNMVEAAHGVPMCIPTTYEDPYSGTYLSPGPQTLDGDQAIAYVRMRHGKNTSGSDLDRIDRQQQFLKNLAKKVISSEMLYRPQDITNFIMAVADSLTLDNQLGDVLGYTGGLAFSLRHLDPTAGIVMATAPVEAYPADHNRVQFSAKANAIWEALRNDQPIAPLLDKQSASPANEEAPASTGGGSSEEGTGGSAGGSTGGGSQDAGVDPAQQILDACQVG